MSEIDILTATQIGLSMALKGLSIWGSAKVHQLCFAKFQTCNSRVSMNLRYDLEKCDKRECCCLGVIAQRATTPVEDEKPVVPGVESSGVCNQDQENESKGFHKDVNLLPSELSLSYIFQDGSFPFYVLLNCIQNDE